MEIVSPGLIVISVKFSGVPDFVLPGSIVIFRISFEPDISLKKSRKDITFFGFFYTTRITRKNESIVV